MSTDIKKGYTVNDRRGQNKEVVQLCRVCGAPVEHSSDYNRPTMDCINYLKAEIKEARAAKKS